MNELRHHFLRRSTHIALESLHGAVPRQGHDVIHRITPFVEVGHAAATCRVKADQAILRSRVQRGVSSPELTVTHHFVQVATLGQLLDDPVGPYLIYNRETLTLIISDQRGYFLQDRDGYFLFRFRLIQRYDSVADLCFVQSAQVAEAQSRVAGNDESVSHFPFGIRQVLHRGQLLDLVFPQVNRFADIGRKRGLHFLEIVVTSHLVVVSPMEQIFQNFQRVDDRILRVVLFQLLSKSVIVKIISKVGKKPPVEIIERSNWHLSRPVIVFQTGYGCQISILRALVAMLSPTVDFVHIVLSQPAEVLQRMFAGERLRPHFVYHPASTLSVRYSPQVAKCSSASLSARSIRLICRLMFSSPKRSRLLIRPSVTQRYDSLSQKRGFTRNPVYILTLRLFNVITSMICVSWSFSLICFKLKCTFNSSLHFRYKKFFFMAFEFRVNIIRYACSSKPAPLEPDYNSGR